MRDRQLFLFKVLLVSLLITHYNRANENLSLIAKDFSIGALSGIAAMSVYTPFHYFQNKTIQNLPIEKNPHYWFRGYPSLALGKAPTLAVQMASYKLITRLLQKNSDLTTQQKIIASTIAGGISGMVNNFTHLIALHQENTGASFLKTIQLHGNKTLMRGLGTTIAREIFFTNIYRNILSKNEEMLGCLLTSIAIALSTQPFMVVTAKLYADINKQEYKNGIDATYKILKKDGLYGFYRGSFYRSIGVALAIPILQSVENKLNTIIKELNE